MKNYFRARERARARIYLSFPLSLPPEHRA